MEPIEFVAFAADCTISARMTMFGDRLTDMLNGQERYRLHHVTVQSLSDGHTIETDSIPIERVDLLAVVGTGPRGSEKMRLNLTTSRMQLAVGPYIILGRLHMPPGLDPVAVMMNREPMVPLTAATIAYMLAGEVIARDVPTIIVNRALVEWIVPTSDEATAFPDATVRTPHEINFIKDMTGLPTS